MDLILLATINEVMDYRFSSTVKEIIIFNRIFTHCVSPLSEDKVIYWDCTYSDMSKMYRCSKSSIHRSIDNLVKDGLILKIKEGNKKKGCRCKFYPNLEMLKELIKTNEYQNT